jgi:hypothetical protein
VCFALPESEWLSYYRGARPGIVPGGRTFHGGKLRTFRGAISGTLALVISATALAGTARAAEPVPPSVPYTALTMNFDWTSYIAGSFSYEASRNTIDVYQQTPNGYALFVRGFRDGGWHDINVTPPTGTRFVAGTTYPTTKSWEPLPNKTVVNISGDGQGCDWAPADGALAVQEAVYDDTTGNLTAFAASFSVPCGGSQTATGEIRFQSSIGYQATDSVDYRMQFGAQPVGFNGTPQNAVIEVWGTEPTTFGAASLSGADAGAFSIASNTCSGNTLTYGQTCQLTITPAATAIGVQTALLTLVENSIGGKVKRLLSLEGIDSRDATASPSYFDFGPVPAYDTSAPVTVTVTGSGTTPITFGQLAIVGENPGMFRVTSETCSNKTLALGQTCAITALARPTSGTGAGAIVRLPDDSVAGATQISLYVNGYKSDRGTYYPMSPFRILDTRYGTGVPAGILGPQGVLRLQVSGSGGVPMEASTVVLNVTVTQPSAGGFLAVYPAGVSRPTVSSLNFTPMWTGANSVTVKVGDNGQVEFFNGGNGNVHVLADVFGYYSKGSSPNMGYMGGQYHPLSSPIRLTDTREWGIPYVPGDAYVLSAASWGSATNYRVRAFAVNITAVNPSGEGYLTAWNGYEYGLPNTSTLNYTAGKVVPNFAVVPTTPCQGCGEASGWPSIGVYTTTNVHILVDIVGFYDDGQLDSGLRFEPVVPQRIADSRFGVGTPSRLGPGVTATITTPDTVAGADTWALAANVTGVVASQETFLSVWPAGISGVGRPNTSNLNLAALQTIPNAVQTMVGPDYKFNVFNAAGSCDVLVDVVGTFYSYPPSPPSGWSANRRATAETGSPVKASPLVTTLPLVKQF